MRRRLAWLLGGFALARLFVGRRRPVALPVGEDAGGEPEVDPRAEELRARLAAAKAVVEEVEPAEAAPAEEAVGDPDERRRRVHEAGRAAAEQMRGDATSPE